MLLLCVCLVLFVFQRIKSHTELLTLSLLIACVWPPLLFAGACQQSFRAQTRSPLWQCRSSRPTFRSLSQQLSGLKLSHGEARILRISCQGQARELQGPDCLSKRTSFQSNWTSSAETSKENGPQKQNYDPVGLDNASFPVTDVWGRNTCSLICLISSQCPFMSLLTKMIKGKWVLMHIGSCLVAVLFISW